MSIGTPLLICGAVDNIDFARYYSSSWLGFCFFLFYLFGLFLVSTCSCDPVQTRYKFSSWLWPKLHYGDLLWICWTTSRGRTCATQHLGMSRCSRVIADLRLSTCTCCIQQAVQQTEVSGTLAYILKTQNFPISQILPSIDIWHLFGLLSRIPGLLYGFFLFQFFF